MSLPLNADVLRMTHDLPPEFIDQAHPIAVRNMINRLVNDWCVQARKAGRIVDGPTVSVVVSGHVVRRAGS